MSTAVNSNFQHIKRTAIALLLTQPFMTGGVAWAQSIVPTNDLGTQVNSATTNPQQLNITGGTQVDANLYHSFQQFGLNQGQIANFLSNPSIQNILGRVVGGSPSVINGLIQVTGGNSNLYLLNPAGIIFGSNASLNVPAAFTATTASGIQVGNGWFGVNTSVDAIKNLSGNPQAFGFAANTSSSSSSTPQGAPVINAGNLTVNQGQSITLVGGLVINTGTIASPSGKVTIAAVPDGKYVKITPEGSLLSLELPIAAQQELAQRSILGSDLPKLLTGSSELRNITGLNVDSSGNVLVANNPIPSTAGTAIASGNLDVSSTNAKGGEINVSGDRVALVAANLNASGAIGGGTVLIGGDYLGKGIVPNSQITVVDQASTIRADALQSGNGGKVIVWADDKTSFDGKISVRGGSDNGNGGFVETSGKNYLSVKHGSVNASTSNGLTGSWLLDPRNITIQAGGLPFSAALLTNLALASDVTNDFTIDPNAIQTQANVTLEASNDVTFNASVNNNAVGNNTLQVNAGNKITIAASQKVQLSSVSPNSRNIIFNAKSIDILGTIGDSLDTTNVSLNATGDIFIAPQSNGYFNRAIEGSNISIVSTNGNISTGSIRATDSTLVPTPNGIQVVLTANNGSISLDGFIQAGDANNALNDSQIIITAQRFTAINPLSSNANFVKTGDIASPFNDGQQNPTSLIAYAAFTNDTPKGNAFPAFPVRSIQLQLPGDASPRTIAGSGAPIISINILKDTTFSIYPKAILSGTSGTNSAISQGVSSIPPNVLVLISDQSFSSNRTVLVLISDQSFSSDISLTANTLTANTLSSDVISATRATNTLTANALSEDAISATLAANLEANASQGKDCKPIDKKKPILTITSSLPTSTRTAQNPTPSKLPPCKE